MDYNTTKEAAEKWGILDRRVLQWGTNQRRCQNGEHLVNSPKRRKTGRWSQKEAAS